MRIVKDIQIDWKKIYEDNPDGLREWLTTQFPLRVHMIWFEGININVATKDGRTSKMRYISKLNEKALDLIFWLDEKGIIIDASWDFSGDLNWCCTISRKSDGKYFHIDHDMQDRQAALTIGIEKAFELLNDKG